MNSMERLFKSLSTYQIISLSFILLIFSGALLLMLPFASQSGDTLNFLDALFTATSASCVTGLVVVDTGHYFTVFGQLVIITMIQLGGLGIMTFATLFSVAVGKRINLQERLRIQESLNQGEIHGIVSFCLRIVKLTVIIEFFFGTLLAIRFLPIFGFKGLYYGYWHAISAFCNAGFDLMGDYTSFSNYVGDVPINLIITSLIILGSTGFTVMADVIYKPKFSSLRLHSKIALLTTLFLIVAGTFGIYYMEHANNLTIGNLSEGQKILASYFQAVTPRTAGFNTIPIENMRQSTLLLVIMLMFIGASPASTGGGIKTTTFAVVVLSIRNMLHGNNDLVLFDRRIDNSFVYRAFVITVLAIVWISIATLFIAYFERATFLHVLFEVVSAFATVGLSTGISRNLCAESKIVLILTMFAGRVGILTFALALTSRHRVGNIRYPKEKIMIG